jgi:hypothetical protein
MSAFSLEANIFLERAGKKPPFKVESLRGGRNSQVCKVDDFAGDAFVLKRYFYDSSQQKDRATREWNFLLHAHEVCGDMVAEPIAYDKEFQSIVMEYVPGNDFIGENITEKDVLAASEFIYRLNNMKECPSSNRIENASEACFDMAEQVDLMNIRIQRLLRVIDLSHQHRLMGEFVRNDLVKSASKLSHVASQIDQRKCPILLSPSDFGFHNAIKRSNGSVVFLDFEYAGRDGAGKMVADFFLQPRVKVDENYLGRFISPLEKILGEKGFVYIGKVLPVMLAIQSVKWCCILMNEFLPRVKKRREFSDGEAQEDRLLEQRLESAKCYFNRITLPRIKTYY